MLNSQAIAGRHAAREGSLCSRPLRGRGGCKAFPKRQAHAYLAHDLSAQPQDSHRVSLRHRGCVERYRLLRKDYGVQYGLLRL
jgi:hypothetical protein